MSRSIDPSGRGKDETSYACVKLLHGQALLVASGGGYLGGLTDSSLIEPSRSHSVRAGADFASPRAIRRSLAMVGLHGWLNSPSRAMPSKMTSANSRVPGSAPVFFRLKQSAARLTRIALRGRRRLVTIC